MSTLTVPLTTIDEVRPHPNADRLDLAVIGGWQVVVAKGSVSPGQVVIYVPPDSVVPDTWAEAWGVKPYLSKGERVKAVKLRGEPSFGFAVPILDAERDLLPAVPPPIDMNVADLFGITKYEPPARGDGSIGRSDRLPEDPRFSRYTDIENLRHHTHAFVDGETVVATEKIHGTNSRVGYIEGVRVAGSHRVQRPDPNAVLVVGEQPSWWERFKAWAACRRVEQITPRNPGSSVYWQPFDETGVTAMLTALARVYQQVILYGEIYGPSIQRTLGYGVDAEATEYRAFDLMLNGKYVDHHELVGLCRIFGVPMVPVLYEGPYSLDAIKAVASGQTVLNDAGHIREGVVVRPITERQHPRLGRLILKYVSPEYLTGDFED